MNLPESSSTSEIILTPSLVAVSVAFFQLGCTAFGGPASHISLMEAELVRRRNWLTHADFVDLFGAASLLPGPTSTELAMLIGQRLAGFAGLFVAGFFFTAPAAVMVLVIASIYLRYGTLPAVHGALYGVKPVVVAMILNAFLILSRTALSGLLMKAVFGLALIAVFVTNNPLSIMIFSGTGVAIARTKEKRVLPLFLLLAFSIALIAIFQVLSQASLTTSPSSNSAIFAYFLRVGATVFGSGYVLVAFIRDDLVSRLHWLTNQQLLDAITVGQVTPGPLFTTATFIGYVLHGWHGALWATVGVFLPAFIYSLVAGPLIPRMKQIAITNNFLAGVNAAALALVASVGLQLGATAVCDAPTALIGIAALAGLVRFKWNSTWLLVGAAALGWVIQDFQPAIFVR